MTRDAVPGAPFSADATTTVDERFDDGTRQLRTAKARYYRDGAGRVRVEQSVGTVQPDVRYLVAPDPTRSLAYYVDPVRRTARLGGRSVGGMGVGGGETFAVPLGGHSFRVFWRASASGDALSSEQESLGTKQIDGIVVEGRRTTSMVALKGQPVEVVDERWESAELSLLVYSRYADPRFGVIDYRLTNIRRTEPSAGLFEIDEYTIAPTSRDDPWIELQSARANRETASRED